MDDQARESVYSQEQNAIPGVFVVIAYGDTVSGDISTVAEEDAFYFSGTAGDRVRIQFVKLSGAMSVRAELFDDQGTLIEYSTSGTLTETLSSAETYKIIIQYINYSVT